MTPLSMVLFVPLPPPLPVPARTARPSFPTVFSYTQNFVDFFEIDLFGIKCEHIDWSNVYTWPPPPPSAAEDENV